MYVLIVLAIIVLIVGIVIIWKSFDEFFNDTITGLISGVFITSMVVAIIVAILSPIVVLYKNSGMTIGTITSVDKNYWGSTAIYLKTAETAQEKYCAENEEIIEFAKNNIGKKVKIGYGTRVGFYKLSQCDQAPIIHIERVENVQSKD
jgi:hypothetical protein